MKETGLASNLNKFVDGLATAEPLKVNQNIINIKPEPMAKTKGHHPVKATRQNEDGQFYES